MRLRISLLLVLVVVTTSVSAQDQYLVPGDNLILDGIPKIPQSIVDKVGRYTKFRTAAFADWHPTKAEMLILTRAGDTMQVHRVSEPGAKPEKLTAEKDSIAGAWYEPRDGKYFIFSKSAGGSERFQLYRYDFNSANDTLLTDGKSRNSPPHWSRKGDRIAYMSTRRNGADTDLYVMDPADPKTDRLVREFKGGGWTVLDWSPDDAKLLIGEYISINESRLHLFDFTVKTLERITPRGMDAVAYTAGKFSPDGTVVNLLTDRNDEFRYVAKLGIKDGNLERLSASTKGKTLKRDVDTFAFSRDGSQLAMLINEKGVGALHLFAAQKPTERIPLTGTVTGLHWHNDGERLAFQVASAKLPGDVHVLDVPRGKLERWTNIETGLATKALSEPEPIEWKSFDDLFISGFLYRPPAKFKGKRPVIIDIHGGPESQYRPRFLGRNNYYLDEMGIALIYPNVRGSSGFGKTFLTLDNGFKREDSYKDIGALLDWIKAQPDLDADRVMVTGGSYGGHMTLAVATYFPDRIRCAVDVVGISNLRTLLENTEPYRRDLRRVEYGDERDPKMREFLNRIAPLTNAHKIKAPLFIVHGANDPRVPLSEAEQIRDVLKKQGTPVWWLVARDEGHGFAKKRNADFQFYATVMFVEQYLLK